jgi:hypothetical protein
VSGGALAVTGDASGLMTSVGLAFIVGGIGVLMFTRRGENEDTRRTHVPAPRRGRHAADDARRTDDGGRHTADHTTPRPPRLRKPSPTPVGRHFR